MTPASNLLASIARRRAAVLLLGEELPNLGATPEDLEIITESHRSLVLLDQSVCRNDRAERRLRELLVRLLSNTSYRM